MIHKLDVFRLENGGVLWLESAASLGCAKARIQELAARSPGECLVLDQATGNKHVIRLAGEKWYVSTCSTKRRRALLNFRKRAKNWKRKSRVAEFLKKFWKALGLPEMALESASPESGSDCTKVDGKLDLSSTTDGTVLRASLPMTSNP